jgi:hypothetical protein
MRAQSVPIVLALVPVAACSLIVGSDVVQCTTDSDCASRGFSPSATCVNSACVVPDASVVADASGDGATDGAEASDEASLEATVDADDGAVDPWACVGKVTAPALDMSRMVPLTVQISDSAMRPVMGAMATVCDRTDPLCLKALGPTLASDASGMVTWQVPYAARVFVTVTTSGYLKSLIFVDPPPTMPVTVSIEVLTQTTAQAFANFSGMHTYNPSEGVIILNVEDCRFLSGMYSADVQFGVTAAARDASAADTFGFYLVNMSPDFTASETTSDGVGGFLNVPMGLATVSAILPQRGNLKIGQNEVIVQPNTITFATIEPYEN